MSFNSHDCETVSMKEAQEQEKNNPVTQIAAATSIAFVVLAEGGQIDDVTATENVEQFAPLGLPDRLQKGQYPPLRFRPVPVQPGPHFASRLDPRGRRVPVVEDRRPDGGMAGMVPAGRRP